MKRVIIVLAIMLGMGYTGIAQETKKEEKSNKKTSKLSLEMSFKNRHLWRCAQSINGFSVQSTLSYQWSFLNVGAWGAYELGSGSYSEVDIFAEFNFLKSFTLGIYDFYAPKERGGRTYKGFSDFNKVHTIDMFLKYKGTKSFPLGGLVAAYVFGNDKNDKDEQRYSTYLEMNYTLSLTPKSNVFFYIGATTTKESAYAARKIVTVNGQETKVLASDEDFNIIGLGAKYSKNIKLGNFDATVSGDFLYNPNVDAVYMAFAASIAF